MKRKKLLLIFNPRSGKGEFSARLADVVDRFTKSGFEVTVHPTQEKNDAFKTILDRAGDFGYICASGGDGMMSESIDAVMRLKKRLVFGYIPSGTTNDFANSLKIPRDAILAADSIISGISSDVDVGCFGGKYFAYVAAFGLFTDVPYVTKQDIKNMLGHAAYMLEGAMRLGSIISYNCEIDIGGEKISGEFIFGMASNTVSVGGFRMPVDTVIQLDDGLFEILLVKKPKKPADLQHIVSSLLNKGANTDFIILRQAKSLRVATKTPLEWTLDGEFGGTTMDIFIENKKRAFEIMTPRPKIIVESL